MSLASERVTASVRAGLGALGYGADRLFDDYEFSDVGTSDAETRQVSLAAFTHSPPSYRSAAFGVIDGGRQAPSDTRLGWLSSLGAPVAFMVQGSEVVVLKVGGSRTVTRIETLAPGDIPRFIDEQRIWWAPDAMRRFKLFGVSDPLPPQLDFFDVGLLSAVEERLQGHLDVLLSKVLTQLKGPSKSLGKEALATVFRMLAAKVLLDRRHPEAMAWASDAESVLSAIGSYYGLDQGHGFDEAASSGPVGSVDAAWATMQAGLSLRNVSSDDLAFVYENSFVTELTRVRLGTHSTPRSVVDYACDRLPFGSLDEETVRVFEPFAGAGVFLIAAARRLGDRMGHLSPAERHTYLVERVGGSDVDGFACQVAQLSLILADYPNRNGWKVRQGDLFASTDWLGSIGGHSIVFCNPPYERFKEIDRRTYRENIGSVPTKALWTADRLVRRKPGGLALVLPRGFALDRSYDGVRAGLEDSYDDIEVLALPENTFNKAGFETCLLIGKSLRDGSAPRLGGATRVTNAFVSRADLPAFKSTGKPSWVRTQERLVQPAGRKTLWAGDLEPIWQDLRRRCAPLSSRWTAHRGIEWLTGLQETAWSLEPHGVSRTGYHSNEGMMAFERPRQGWLDVEPGHLRGNAHLLPWNRPKVMLNAARRSRGPWRVTAFVEREDFAASQQFIAIWPTVAGASLDALAAILNGPVANAFLNDLSFGKGLRLEDIRQVPLPRSLEEGELAKLVSAYQQALELPGFDRQKETLLGKRLLAIDAFVLAAYDLAPKAERMLLRQFSGHIRQVPFLFNKFYEDAVPALPLRDILDGILEQAQWPKLAPAFARIGQADGEALWEVIG